MLTAAQARRAASAEAAATAGWAHRFHTIFVTPGLDPKRRRRAQRSGPRAVGSRTDQRQLLVSAGYTDVEVVDLTPEWMRTSRGWIDGWSTNKAELTAFESPKAFAERQRGRRAQHRAIEDGLLKRALFSATRPL